ncbi:MAG: DNA methyltransferase [Chloroflexota bacterium]|nr:DNA methyltransferase [Chloroflexota bacterium]MDE2841052.1 DNA methyltransferase [Chloroflexota bacterium]MDE2929409.1 DNA methyltransferase [Chloroflexota bacterium]
MSLDPNFANRTIWTGDNLDILRGLNSNCVDLIYLDPPFNSNRNYAAPVGSKAAGAAFKDTWTLSDLDVAWMGLIADEQPAVYRVIETAGLTHGKGMQSYLCMMAVRLLEMKRVLKESGSVYLHCDSTASHYLKLLMDAVFGSGQFQNHVTWRRTTAHSDSVRYGSNADHLLYYTNGEQWTWNPQYQDYDEKYKARFRRKDPDGRLWSDDNITAKGLSGGGYEYEYKGVSSLWRVPLKTMERLDAEGRLHFTSKGGIRLKRYLDEMQGRAVQALWDDIDAINSQARERTGYPTQKPIALLERIIKASSNEGDVVLDPFAGCATACVAAESLGRKWIGIDLSPKAVELVRLRLAESMGGLFHDRLVTSRSDIPKRTDIDAPIHYRQNKHVLFGQQEGQCNGCKMEFPFKVLEVDHVLPRSRGGTDHLDNLQLLCSHCNRTKGDRPQEYLINELSKMRSAGRFVQNE